MIIDRIAQAVSEFYHQDFTQKRIIDVGKRYKKSPRKKALLKGLREKRKIAITERFNYLAKKYDVKFEKLNQIIYNDYSLKIKNNEPGEMD